MKRAIATLGFGIFVVGASLRRRRGAQPTSRSASSTTTPARSRAAARRRPAIGNKIAIDMINETRRRRGLQDRRRSSPTPSRRSTSRSTRPSGCSTSRRSTSSWACIRARIACRWPPRSTPRRSSSGSTSASPPRCSRTRSCNTCSGRRCIPTSSARRRASSSPKTPRRSSARRSKDVKVAIIHEDGPYGVGVAHGQRGEVQEARHADRAQGRLFGDRDRSLRAGDASCAARSPT